MPFHLANRRVVSAGFSPLQIAGCQLWLDADDAASFTYSSSTVVSQWNDLSGNARHMANATTSLQPNRNGVQNGKSTVVFNGTNNYLAITSGITIGLTALTVFVVGQEFVEQSNSGFLVMMAGGTNDYDNANSILFTSSSTANLFDLASFSQLAAITGTGRSPMSVFEGVKSGTGAGQVATYRDGTAGGTGTVAAAGTADVRWLIGNRYYAAGYRTVAGDGGLNGSIAEIIVYDTALSTTDRQSVETYLKAKWNLPFVTITDSFNRADSTTTMGSTDTGLTWVPNSGVWGINTNQAYIPGAVNQLTTVVESGVSDCSAQGTIGTTGDIGLCVRSTDDSNYFATSGFSDHSLYKRQAGTFSNLGTIVAVAANDVEKITMSGSSIAVYINGVQQLSVTNTHNQTATKHGLRSSGSSSDRWDDFSVTVP